MIYLFLGVGALLLIVLALWGAGAMDSILKEDKRQ
jgi:hypothetical protein|tara:strand:- start:910 stop:1014 length:105 start_codon:yes stop_codon:yes gene_type:complete